MMHATTHYTKAIGPLDNDTLRHNAPSLFAAQPIAGVSERYTFLPTIDIVERMRTSGWLPVSATQQTVRTEERRGFQKHLVKFQRAEDLTTTITNVGDVRPEVVLINSHDKSSAFHIHAGLFRLVCMNGLVVADATFGRVSVRHSGFDPDSIIDASFEVVETVPQILDSVDAFKAREMDKEEQTAFARAALMLKYDEVENAPVSPERILSVHRSADTENNLWTTFNVVQENLIRGGQRADRRREDGRRFQQTRGIKGIDQDIKLNKSLWHLAEFMAGRAELN